MRFTLVGAGKSDEGGAIFVGDAGAMAFADKDAGIEVPKTTCW